MEILSAGNWPISWSWGFTVVRRQVMQELVIERIDRWPPTMWNRQLSIQVRRVGPACSNLTCYEQMSNLEFGCWPWVTTGWRLGKSIFALWMRPPTRNKLQKSRKGWSANRQLEWCKSLTLWSAVSSRKVLTLDEGIPVVFSNNYYPNRERMRQLESASFQLSSTVVSKSDHPCSNTC